MAASADESASAGENPEGNVSLLDTVSEAVSSMTSSMKMIWDPLRSDDWDNVGIPSQTCLRRIHRDLMAIYTDPPHGIFAVPDENQSTLIHVLIVGPHDTPYEGGFFYFIIRFPPDYPNRPPRVRLLTTGDDQVRFNPNLYRDGKVCLSILGTFPGPSWSPAQSLTSVLVSIQSLMSEKPYHNEPGFEKEHRPGDSQAYNEIIEHETIRVAVIGMLDDQFEAGRRCPASLKEMIERSFAAFHDRYVEVCEKLMNLQDKAMIDPFRDRRGRFTPKQLLERLKTLKEELERKLEQQISEPEEEEADSDLEKPNAADEDSPPPTT